MKDLIERIPVLDLLTERYAIAAIVLWAIRPQSLRRLSRDTWVKGLVLGALFGSGQTSQAVALQDLPSAVSGFAVGCSVVMTPLLGLFILGIRVTRRVWLAVALSTVAMALFTLLNSAEGGEIDGFALGLTLMAATLYAAHTLVLGRTGGDAYAISVIQLGTIAVMTGLVGVADGLTLPQTPADWAVLGHLAIIACALGFLGRTFGQRHVPPVPAAVIMSAQPLWVAVFALLLYGEALTWSMITGGGLIVSATLLVVCRTTPAPQPVEQSASIPVEMSAVERDALLRARWMASQVLLLLQRQHREAEAHATVARRELPLLGRTHWCPPDPGIETISAVVGVVEAGSAGISAGVDERRRHDGSADQPGGRHVGAGGRALLPHAGRPDHVNRMVERAISIVQVHAGPGDTSSIVSLVVAVEELDVASDLAGDVALADHVPVEVVETAPAEAERDVEGVGAEAGRADGGGTGPDLSEG